MKYQLQLKPFESKDGFKYKVIQITDIALHSSNRRSTKSINNKIRQAIEQNKPGRIYGEIDQGLPANISSTDIINYIVKHDPDFLKMIREEELKGCKILLELPKEGIPILLGNDTLEFIESKNGQRLIRGLNKTND